MPRYGNTHKLEWTVEVGDDAEERDVLVTYSYVAGTPASRPTWTDPGYPGDPPEIEVITVEDLETGQSYILSGNAEEKLIEDIADRHEEAPYEDYEEWDR